MQLNTVIDVTVHFMSALIAADYQPEQQYFDCAFFAKEVFLPLLQ